MKVIPTSDAIRKHIKHPSRRLGFPENGPAEWPDDSFTARRIADGDITVVEETQAQPAKKSETK